MDQYKVGRFISKLRKEKNLTQRDLAEKLGITNQAVSKWERGENLPDLSLLVELSNIFKVTVDEILNGKKNDKATEFDPINDYNNKTQSTDYFSSDIDNRGDPNRRKTLTALAVASYVISPLSFIIFSGNTFLKFTTFFSIAGAATFMLVLATPNRSWDTNNRRENEKSPLASIIYGIATLVFFILGYAYGWWRTGWLVYVVAALVLQIITLFRNTRK